MTVAVGVAVTTITRGVAVGLTGTVDNSCPGDEHDKSKSREGIKTDNFKIVISSTFRILGMIRRSDIWPMIQAALHTSNGSSIESSVK